MGTIATSSIVFACVFGAMLGMFIRAILPQHHLSFDSKDSLNSAWESLLPCLP
jgi:hypothetical protein